MIKQTYFNFRRDKTFSRIAYKPSVYFCDPIVFICCRNLINIFGILVGNPTINIRFSKYYYMKIKKVADIYYQQPL